MSFGISDVEMLPLPSPVIECPLSATCLTRTGGAKVGLQS